MDSAPRPISTKVWIALAAVCAGAVLGSVVVTASLDLSAYHLCIFQRTLCHRQGARDGWADAHILFGAVFIVGGALHLYFNWKPFMSYLAEHVNGHVSLKRVDFVARRSRSEHSWPLESGN
jgi:hypothetical protein